MKFSAHPDTCSCCAGIEMLTPLPIANRPGLPALAYRIGAHGDFLESMLARLASLSVPVDENGAPLPWDGEPDGCGPEPQVRPGDPCADPNQRRHYLLRALTTRRRDDPAIALLDAWATVADVMTFYQERIANEGYLRTASERRSLQGLARLVGYKLRPGVAASVYLAFELDQNYQVEVPAGTRAQSVPQPGDMPQPFETSADLDARFAWNAIPARSQRPQYIARHNIDDVERVYLEGLSTQLAPNDPLLFVFGVNEGEQVARFVQAIEAIPVIEPVPGAGYTIVDLQSPDIFAAAQRVANRHLPPESFGVNPGAISGDMVEALNRMSQAGTRSALRSSVQAALGVAQQTLPNFAGENLRSWLQNLATELSALADRLQPSLASNGQAESESAFPFLAQAEAQLKEPARRLGSGSELPRNLAQILSPGAGALPEMITTLKPRLAPTFYAAWGSAQTISDPQLQQLAALRVKAAPFGHNAAPMPILDDQGVVIGETEWPLEAGVRLQVTLPLQSTGNGPVPLFNLALAAIPATGQAAIFVKAAGQSYHSSLLLQPDAILQLPVGSVTVEEVGDDTVRFLFDVDGVERNVRFTGSDGGVEISLDDELLAVLSPGQSTVIELEQDHRATAFYSASGVGVIDENLRPSTQRDVLYLDTAYDQIQPQSWVLVDRPRWPEPRAFQVEQVDTVNRSAYKLSGKTTRLVLSGDWLEEDDLLLSDIRSTTVYAQSDALKQVDERYDDPVKDKTIELDGLYDGLESGRWIFVGGERVDIPGASGVEDVELAMIANVVQGVQQVRDGNENLIDRPGDKAHTILELAQPLTYSYARATVKVRANVSQATHGATVREIIGSGDARKAFQSFSLRQAPLTYVPAPTLSGVQSTLEVRVNDVLWPEVERLFLLDGNERGYELRREDDGEKDQTTVIFGDGQHGARLPSGVENVEAVYRHGLGEAGNVTADTITMLLTRPLGVKGVNNPQRASGGAARDDREDARRNAPLTVTALDRLVSAQDYADFARMFAGVGKASAMVFPQRRGKLVNITIAGAADIHIDVNSDLYRNLNLALQRYGDPSQPFAVDVRELLLLIVSANVRLLPDYRWESVETQIRSTLLDTFGFECRELGQDVYAAEIIVAIQQTPGVAFVDLDFLGSLSEEESLDEEALKKLLPQPLPPRPREGVDVFYARHGAGLDILPAQLAILSPKVSDTLILTELP